VTNALAYCVTTLLTKTFLCAVKMLSAMSFKNGDRATLKAFPLIVPTKTIRVGFVTDLQKKLLFLWIF